jgi:hypothetical protein
MSMSGGHEVVAGVGAGAMAYVMQAVREADASHDAQAGRVEYAPASDAA